jgi:hypothetical protein
MRKIILTLAILLSGCAGIKDMIPSFWDDAQAAKIVDIRLAAERFDCASPHLPQLVRIRDDIRWFDLYSRGKGWRQNDVLRLVAPLGETVEDFYKRTQDKEGSVAYCKIKRQIMITQSSRAAEAVLGRF